MKPLKQKTRLDPAISAMRQRLRDTLSGAAGYDTTCYIADGDLIAIKTSPPALERFVAAWIPKKLGDMSIATIDLLAIKLTQSEIRCNPAS